MIETAAKAKARRIKAAKLWHECQRVHLVYFQARQKAIAEVDESLEHLLVASMEATAAYKEASIGLMRYPTPNARRTA